MTKMLSGGNRAVCSTALIALGFLPTALFAGGTIKIDDDKSISIGAGLRTSFSMVENSAPNGTDYSKDSSLDSVRLYVNGQVMKGVNLVFNTERQSDGTVRVLDGVAQFSFADTFNLWSGRFLPPSDRSNLSGPYYLATWDFPLVQNYPAIFAGRDDGLAVWGQTGGGKFKYQVGAFQGRNGAATSNRSDSLLYAGRLVFNFWDPESGYYNASTYYGAKEILALGLTAQTQTDGAGTATNKADFKGESIDALMEKKLGSDVASLEGAYYSYDTGNVSDAALYNGHGYFAQLSYLLGNKIGPGKLQPHLRYQSADVTSANISCASSSSANKCKRYDVGVNYILSGHNARLSAIFANEDRGTKDANIIRLGLQVQI